MVSAVVTFASVAVLVTSSGSWWVGVVVAIGLALGYALDSADGQVARLRGGGSMVGEWLDHMIDSAKITTVHLAVAVVAYRTFDIGTWWLLVPLAFTVVANVHFFGMIFVDQLVRLSQATSGTATPPSRAASSRALMLGKIPLDYGFLCWVFVLIGSPPAFCVVYSMIAAGSSCLPAAHAEQVAIRHRRPGSCEGGRRRVVGRPSRPRRDRLGGLIDALPHLCLPLPFVRLSSHVSQGSIDVQRVDQPA